jgi:acetyl-CoA C-acetyltransferase
VDAGVTCVLGVYQSDFARHRAREGDTIDGLLAEAAMGALADAGMTPADLMDGDRAVAHIGNFAAGLYAGQRHLGGLLIEADPALRGLPVSRHEAACASGSIAVLAAMADLEAGRYDLALVVGVELMRTLNAFDAQQGLGTAAWVPHETEGVDWPWPQLFSDLGDAYDRRYGLDDAHLTAIARSNFDNATRNPRAQTRRWNLDDASFDRADDEANPPVAGRLRRQDCSQVTDGCAAVVLASPAAAAAWARSRGRSLGSQARITGWGHRTDRMAMAGKISDAEETGNPYVVPVVRRTITDALARANASVEDIDVIETHDCFTTTQYLAIDHFGITSPGCSWQAIEDGTCDFDGALPVNPSGGLMGVGHPVGASGVRMLVDQTRQVTGSAGDYQVPGARQAALLNLGGSATTCVALVVASGLD